MPSRKPVDHIAFDLDDTLLDTSRLLVPAASRESSLAMIEAGLNADLPSALKTREEISRSSGRYDMFNQLVAKFGVRPGTNAEAVADRGYQAFYNRTVERDITLLPVVRDLVRDLRGPYGVHLVTAGNFETQSSKIEILHLEGLFDSIRIVDPTHGESKGDAFKSIMAASGVKPERHLSVGNRLDTDIGEAKKLGWMTAWVRYGEYATATPLNEFEKPDFTIDSIEELLTACRL